MIRPNDVRKIAAAPRDQARLKIEKIVTDVEHVLVSSLNSGLVLGRA